MSIIIFFLILFALVVIHEFGHFIVAKMNGVYVEEFGFGFPPRVIGKRIGETLYSLNLLPIGGFVKVFGEEYSELRNKKLTETQKARTFSYKKPWQKASIIVAGVVMNTLLGIIIYYALLSTHNFISDPFILLDQYKFRFGTQINAVIVANTVKGMSAEKAGASSGDMITAYKTEGMTDWKELKSESELIKTINEQQGKQVILQLENVRDGVKKTITVTPQYNDKLKRAIVGVGLADAAIIKYTTPTQKVFSGAMHSYNVVAYTMSSLKKLVTASVKEHKMAPVSDVVSGPVGIFSVINDIVKTSKDKFLTNILNVTAMLSLSLATMNILPFPALDGGRLVFIIYEWVTGRQANEKIERNVNLAGIIVLLSLAALITMNDLIKLFK